MSDRLNILMTSGGGPGVVGHIDAARNNGYAPVRMIVGDVSPDENAGFALGDQAVQIPPAADPDLADKLLAVCRQHDVDVLWPVFDGELAPLGAARDRFQAAGIRLLLADEDTVRLCLDKATFYQRLAETGWAPPFRVVRTPDELRTAAEGFGYPRRRIAIKPREATGGRGFRVIDADHDAGIAFFAERPDATTCTMTAAVEAIAHVNSRGEDGVLVMPFLEGAEHGCDVLADAGQIVAAVTRRKLPPIREGMHTRIVVAEGPAVISIVSRVVEAIGADGLLSVDVREDDEGQLRVLEINPRAGAYLGMACARIDLLGLALARLFDQAPAVEAFRRSSEPAVGLRYWSDLVQVGDQPRVLACPIGCEIPG